jgi:hypothetical protein
MRERERDGVGREGVVMVEVVKIVKHSVIRT